MEDGFSKKEYEKDGGDAYRLKLTKELTEKLEIQMESVKDDMDLLAINKTLNELQKVNPVEINFNEEEAYKKFLASYKPSIQEQEEYEKLFTKRKTNIIKVKNVLRTSFVIIVIALSLNIVTTAVAGINFFKPFLKWTNEVFVKSDIIKGNEDCPSDGLNNQDYLYEDFEQVEKDFNISVLKPYYLPKGYELESIKSQDFGNEISAKYKSDGKYDIYYSVLFNNKDFTIEKNNINVDIYTYNDIDFYVMLNNNWRIVTWDYAGVNYNLYCYVSEEDFIKFIKNLKY